MELRVAGISTPGLDDISDRDRHLPSIEAVEMQL